MDHSSGRRGRGVGRAGMRRRSRLAAPVKQCPNPHCHETDPRYIGSLSEEPLATAPDRIKDQMREHVFSAHRCGYCDVVFLTHGVGRPDQPIGYYNSAEGTHYDGWNTYPPDRRPPAD
jgi:hypothetical protein